MADTTFISKVTTIATAWLQAINDHVYKDTPGVGATCHAASKIGNTPAGTIAAVTVQAAIDELNLDAVTAAAALTAWQAALTASQVANVPAGNIAAVTVQAALAELDAEKALLGGSATQAFLVKAAVLSTQALQAAQLGDIIDGWTYANNGADAVNDIDIAAGWGLDATEAYLINGAALTKQSDVAWAVGTNAGGLDTGAVGNNDYFIWAIVRSDTGVVDYLFSLSSSAPTMPANYDYKRLIGWFKRVGGTIVAFHVYPKNGGAINFEWDAPTLDVTTAALAAARRLDVIKVPLGFKIEATVNVQITDAAAYVVRVGNPSQTDVAPSATVAPLGNLTGNAGNTGRQLQVRTDTSGQIAARATAAITLYAVVTESFIFDRSL